MKRSDTFLSPDNDYLSPCLILNPISDTQNYHSVNNSKVNEKVLKLMNDLQLLDYYRILYPYQKVYLEENNPLKQDCLDYILILDSFC